MIKLRKTVESVKTTEYWTVLKSPLVTLKVVKENYKIKETTLSGKGPHGSYPSIVTKEFLDSVQSENPWVSRGITGMRISKSGEDLKKIAQGKISIEPHQVIFFYSDGHILFDRNGKIIPTVLNYNYIGSPFHNKFCHLGPMLEHLKKSPYVVNGKDDPLMIHDVPYYNNESGNEKFIGGKETMAVRVFLPQEMQQEAYERAVIADKKYFSSRFREIVIGGFVYGWRKVEKEKGVVEKDYLGIKQFEKEKRNEI